MEQHKRAWLADAKAAKMKTRAMQRMSGILTGAALSMLAACGSVRACTVFMAAANGEVLYGNNEDWFDPNTFLWTVPGADGTYGRVYVGYANGFPQGGVNEKGLCFDGLMVPRLELRNTAGKKRQFGNIINKMMAECATVAEAVALLGQYNLRGFERSQFLIADATGDAAVVEAEAVHRKEGRYQVATNFRLSRVEPGEAPCRRYRIATRMLEENDRITVDLFKRILAAVHQEGQAATQYSTIYDLKRGIIYLYHFHNFTNVVRLNVAEELAKGAYHVAIPSLFPPTYVAMMHEGAQPDPIDDAIGGTIDKHGVAEAIKKYRFLKKHEREHWRFEEDCLNRLGYALLRAGKTSEAIEIFKLNVEEYPEAWNPYDSLGEAYMVNGDLDLAIAYYEKSLELNPGNTNAAEKLKELRAIKGKAAQSHRMH